MVRKKKMRKRKKEKENIYIYEKNRKYELCKNKRK
jgi:hypothetical protein